MTVYKSNVPTDSLPVGTRAIVKHIKRRITRNKNYLCAITGQTGSGKSYAAMSLMGCITGKLKTKNICFTAKTFMERVVSGELKKGDVIIWDEAGVDLNSKQWQSLANRVINFVLQTFRNLNLIVIFTLPYLSFLDSDSRKLLHGYMETMSIDEENELAILSPKLIQVNQRTGNVYYKRYRAMSGGYMVPIQTIGLVKPPSSFLIWYEDIKTKFTDSLNAKIHLQLARLEKKELKKQKPKELTKKQQEVWDMTQKGMTQQQIADSLGLAISTVNDRLKSARKKKDLEVIS